MYTVKSIFYHHFFPFFFYAFHPRHWTNVTTNKVSRSAELLFLCGLSEKQENLQASLHIPMRTLTAASLPYANTLSKYCHPPNLRYRNTPSTEWQPSFSPHAVG